MNTTKEKKTDVPTSGKSEKKFENTSETARNYDSTDHNKLKKDPFAPKTPEVSKNTPVEKGRKI